MTPYTSRVSRSSQWPGRVDGDECRRRQLAFGPHLFTELEHRDLPPASDTESDRHDRGADACANVDCAGSIAAALTVETVHVLVLDDLAADELVEPGQGHLARVGVTGEHYRHAVVPEGVGFFGDVREADRRPAAVEALERPGQIGVAGVGVVEAQDLEFLMAHLDARPRVVDHRRLGEMKWEKAGMEEYGRGA